MKRSAKNITRRPWTKARAAWQHSSSKTVTLHLVSGASTRVKSFQEAMRDPALMNETVRGFHVELKCASVEATVNLSRRYCELTVKVAPESSQLAREIFSVLMQWQKSNQPPAWQRIWKSAASFGVHWIAWIFVVLMALTSLAERDPGKLSVKHEAHTLLKTGVSATNQLKALELLLSLESGYSPPVSTSQWPRCFLLFLFGGLIACIILSVPPNTVIGIGRGDEHLRYWRWWLRFVFYLVPVWLISTFVWPHVQPVVQGLFK